MESILLVNELNKLYAVEAPEKNMSQSAESQVNAKQWYAIYCRPRHEKDVFAKLEGENIDAYLPMHTVVKQWSDRKKKVEEPLFSCYVFVNITLHDYYKVLNQYGVIRYVTFEGKAVPIPEEQIDVIKRMLENDFQATDTIEQLPIEAEVEVVSGPLTGIKGELVNYAGKKRVIVRIKEIDKTVMVNISPNCLKQL